MEKTETVVESGDKVAEKEKFSIERINQIAEDFEEENRKIGEWDVPRDRSAYDLTHDFHSYFAAFPPEMARRVILKNSQEGDVFLDPFMGGGSAVIEAYRLGRVPIGVDISPFSKFMTAVKARPVNIDMEAVEKLLFDISRDISAQKEKDYADFSYDVPEVTSMDYWYSPASKFDLCIALHHIRKVQDVALRSFLLLGFSSILRRVSNAKDGEQHLCISKDKKIPEVFPLLDSKIRLMCGQMSDYALRFSGPEHVLPRLFAHDARKLREVLKPDSVDLVVTSPPYGTNSLYTAVHKLSFEWLGFKKPERSETLESSRDLAGELPTVMREIFYVLRPGRMCFLVYGNTFRDKTLAKAAVRSGLAAGFDYRGLISCPMEKKNRRHHQKYRRYVPKEFILIFRKP